MQKEKLENQFVSRKYQEEMAQKKIKDQEKKF